MTNYEKIKEMQSSENLGSWLCRRWEQNILNKHGDEVDCCDDCPATNKCGLGINGFVAWLEEECNE